MAFSSPNEQGFEMKVYGDPRRRVTEFEGVQLVTVSPGAGNSDETGTLPEFPFEVQFLDE